MEITSHAASAWSNPAAIQPQEAQSPESTDIVQRFERVERAATEPRTDQQNLQEARDIIHRLAKKPDGPGETKSNLLEKALLDLEKELPADGSSKNVPSRLFERLKELVFGHGITPQNPSKSAASAELQALVDALRKAEETGKCVIFGAGDNPTQFVCGSNRLTEFIRA